MYAMKNILIVEIVKYTSLSKYFKNTILENFKIIILLVILHV